MTKPNEEMSTKHQRLTIDELLNLHTDAEVRATVEGIADKPELVKITPWFPDTGCLCGLAIMLPKASIADVTLTGDTHICCGKTLRVVELHFVKGTSIGIEELFAQLSAKALTQSTLIHEQQHGSAISQRGTRQPRTARYFNPPRDPPRLVHCEDMYSDCLAECAMGAIFDDYSQCICLCRNLFCFCSRRCIPEICDSGFIR
jgi:hypothetical protein